MSSEPEVLLGKGGPSSAGWHKIETMLDCAKKYQFYQVRQLSTPLAQTPEALAVGSLFHAGRARWFSLSFAMDAPAWEAIRKAVEDEAAAMQLPVGIQAERRALELLTQYTAYYSKRVRPKPIAAEYLLGPAPLVLGDPPEMWRTARLDDLSYYPEALGKLCIGESKTTSTSIDECVNQYSLHGQPMMQAALYRMDPNGEAKYGKIAGVMLDIVKKPYGSDPCKFSRVFVPINEYALDWYCKSMQGYIRAAARIEWDSEVPRNINSCTKMIGRMRVPCQYRDLCSNGQSAASKYVLPEGKALSSHVPEPGKMKYPWE